MCFSRCPLAFTHSRQHEEFRAALRRHGILCLTVRQVLLHDAARSMTARIALEELAMSVLTYELAVRHATQARRLPLIYITASPF